MSDEGKPSGENRRPPSGPVSSPRAYFGRASRAATRALRNGITDAEPFPPPDSPRRHVVYRAGDPAMRLLPAMTLPPIPMTAPLTGAIATLSGVRDGEHERLFIDLGTSLVRATPRRDEEAGTLALILSRTQSAETYRALLASLRYINDAAAPTDGGRRIAVQIVDASGRTQEVVSAAFSVGDAPRDAPRDEPREAPLEEVPEIAGPEIAEPDVAERIVLGEKVRFNSDGDFTLFWWPRLLPGATDRGRRAARPGETEAGDAAANAASDPGSYFSAGGRVYRLFDPPIERPAPVPVRAAAVANDRAPERAATVWAATKSIAPIAALAPAANDAVWTPGSGEPPPGFERARMLRLEDIFGSDMQDALARRLIELRIAAAG